MENMQRRLYQTTRPPPESKETKETKENKESKETKETKAPGQPLIVTPGGRAVYQRSTASVAFSVLSELIHATAPTGMSFSFLGAMRQALVAGGIDFLAWRQTPRGQEEMAQLSPDQQLMVQLVIGAGSWVVVAPILGSTHGLTAAVLNQVRQMANDVHDMVVNAPDVTREADGKLVGHAGIDAKRHADTPPFFGQVSNQGYLLLLQDLATVCFAVQAAAGSYYATRDVATLHARGEAPDTNTVLTAFSGSLDSLRAPVAAGAASMLAITFVYLRDGQLELADPSRQTSNSAMRFAFGRAQAAQDFELRTRLGPVPLLVVQSIAAGSTAFLIEFGGDQPELAGLVSGLVGGVLFFAIADHWAQANRLRVMAPEQLEALANQAPEGSAERVRLQRDAAMARAIQSGDWDPRRSAADVFRVGLTALCGVVGVEVAIASLRNDDFTPPDDEVRASLDVSFGQALMAATGAVCLTTVTVKLFGWLLGAAGASAPPETKLADDSKAPDPEYPSTHQTFSVVLSASMAIGATTALVPPYLRLPATLCAALAAAVVPQLRGELAPALPPPPPRQPTPEEMEVRRQERRDAINPCLQVPRALRWVKDSATESGRAALQALQNAGEPAWNQGRQIASNFNRHNWRTRAEESDRWVATQAAIDVGGGVLRVASLPVVLLAPTVIRLTGWLASRIGREVPPPSGDPNASGPDLEKGLGGPSQAVAAQADEKVKPTVSAASAKQVQDAGERVRRLAADRREAGQRRSQRADDLHAFAAEMHRTLPAPAIGRNIRERLDEIGYGLGPDGKTPLDRKTKTPPVKLTDDEARGLARQEVDRREQKGDGETAPDLVVHGGRRRARRPLKGLVPSTPAAASASAAQYTITAVGEHVKAIEQLIPRLEALAKEAKAGRLGGQGVLQDLVAVDALVREVLGTRSNSDRKFAITAQIAQPASAPAADPGIAEHEFLGALQAHLLALKGQILERDQVTIVERVATLVESLYGVAVPLPGQTPSRGYGHVSPDEPGKHTGQLPHDGMGASLADVLAGHPNQDGPVQDHKHSSPPDRQVAQPTPSLPQTPIPRKPAGGTHKQAPSTQPASMPSHPPKTAPKPPDRKSSARRKINFFQPGQAVMGATNAARCKDADLKVSDQPSDKADHVRCVGKANIRLGEFHQWRRPDIPESNGMWTYDIPNHSVYRR
jgi:hypothetical protein